MPMRGDAGLSLLGIIGRLEILDDELDSPTGADIEDFPEIYEKLQRAKELLDNCQHLVEVQMPAVYCQVCGRRLHSLVSRLQGFGPVCLEHELQGVYFGKLEAGTVIQWKLRADGGWYRVE